MEENGTYRIDLPVILDIKATNRILRNGKMGGRMGDRLAKLADELSEPVRKAARPVAIYRQARPRIIDSSTVEVDGVKFTSKVLNKLMQGQDVVYPFITTIGKELDELSVPPQEMMKQFALDSIKTVVLVNAVDALAKHISIKHNIPKYAFLNPGEIEDWHITEQKPLFELFDDPTGQIGVSLTAGGVMKPIKSRSGFIFANEEGFVSCRLCTQLDCPGRKAKYDPEVQKRYLA